MDLSESKRIIDLSVFEDNLYLQGYETVAGIDEAGRGALAGPIVAAAVILPRKNYFIEKINDSKKLKEEFRNELYDKIINSCISYGIGKIGSRLIDSIKLGNANKEVFKKALYNLKKKPEIVITDALSIDSEIPVLPIINGDELCVSVCAASIIAKVFRDRIMVKFDEIYPGYGFKNNKGYGTAEHIKSIKKLGFCPIHRKSFHINEFFQGSFF
ncbi:MAG: ribonuclease HII [Actinomycetota bacterium]|jgi:ribonuclease HII|nr:ribonuclease HII [Actinomycetota bacterium]